MLIKHILEYIKSTQMKEYTNKIGKIKIMFNSTQNKALKYIGIMCKVK